MIRTRDMRVQKPRPKPACWWKCLKCGHIYTRATAKRPKRGCPKCRDKTDKLLVRKATNLNSALRRHRPADHLSLPNRIVQLLKDKKYRTSDEIGELLKETTRQTVRKLMVLKKRGLVTNSLNGWKLISEPKKSLRSLLIEYLRKRVGTSVTTRELSISSGNNNVHWWLRIFVRDQWVAKSEIGSWMVLEGIKRAKL